MDGYRYIKSVWSKNVKSWKRRGRRDSAYLLQCLTLLNTRLDSEKKKKKDLISINLNHRFLDPDNTPSGFGRKSIPVRFIVEGSNNLLMADIPGQELKFNQLFCFLRPISPQDFKEMCSLVLGIRQTVLTAG